MEDARPDESVELELMLHRRDAIDEEVVVKVLPDSKQIVVKLLNLFVLAKDLYCIHLALNHCVEALNELVLELLSELV